MNKGERRHIEIPFLAIARSLGDHWSYNIDTKEFVVSPDPDVGVVAIDPAKFRLIRNSFMNFPFGMLIEIFV